MARTTRNTYMNNWSTEWRNDYAERLYNFYNAGKSLEKDAAFNGRDGHHISDGLHEPSHRSPKGYNKWETVGSRTASDRQWTKRTTSRIIRNRGKNEIRKALLE